MENTSFLEQPLDRDLYEPKKFSAQPKEPLRILITNARCKIAFNLIYEICSGNVFGQDQEVILHLINSRGPLSHKSVALELEVCGFSVFKDIVVSSDPAVVYGKVDIIVVLATYEEIPGRQISRTLMHQLLKAQRVMRYAHNYAKKDVKIIFAGPSTKALTTLLSAFPNMTPKFPLENITCVTALDAFISKAMLGEKLKTTTDKIKNVIILGCTFPDVHKATVRMYPPNDLGATKMEDIPIAEAIQDDHWLSTTFPLGVYQRVISPDLITYGKAVSQAITHHLKALFNDSEDFGEIFSMGVIVKNQIYGVPPHLGFSFPVKAKNGNWKVVENLRFDPASHLNILRTVFNHTKDLPGNSIIKIVSYMVDYKRAKKQDVYAPSKDVFDEYLEERRYLTKYYVTPNLAEGVRACLKGRNRTSTKSIFWGDEWSLSRKKQDGARSSIRFFSEILGRKERQTIGYNNRSKPIPILNSNTRYWP